MADKQYIVSIRFDQDFMDSYNEVKDFEIHYPEYVMKYHAMPEKTEKNKKDKKARKEKLEEDFLDISSKIFTKDDYDIRNFYDEIILSFNTYAQHDRIHDIFIFNDSFTPVYVFTYIAKMYPKFLDYIQTYTLSCDNVVLVDFTKLNV